MFATVKESCQHFLHGIDSLGIQRNDAIEVFRRELGLCRLCYTEKLWIIGWQSSHILFDIVQYFFFGFANVPDEAGSIVMDFHSSGRSRLKFLRIFNQSLGYFFIDISFWRHSAHNTGPAYCHVAFFMSDENRRAYGMVTSPCRVGSIDANDNRNAQFLQFRMAEEGRTASSTIGEAFLLLHQLGSTAVKHPNQGQMHSLGNIGYPKNIVCLTG